MHPPLRIVSLLPSATEFVHLLGLGEALVGRSHECDAPASIAATPVCTRSLVADGDSAAIDAEVRRRLDAGLPLYEIDEHLVRELAPTHVLTQRQCEVCAISAEDVQRMLERGWSGELPELVSLSPRTLGDVFADLQHVGRALGAVDTARDAASALADRVSLVGEKTGAMSPRPRVLCLEWLEPPIAAGNWMPELVRIAGGEPVFGSVGAHSVDVSWSDIGAADPDHVLVMPCGFDLERTLDESRVLGSNPAWTELRAVREGHVTAVDGNAYFNRSGPRLVDSLELLAEILHPDLFGTDLFDLAAKRLIAPARA